MPFWFTSLGPVATFPHPIPLFWSQVQPVCSFSKHSMLSPHPSRSAASLMATMTMLHPSPALSPAAATALAVSPSPSDTVSVRDQPAFDRDDREDDAMCSRRGVPPFLPKAPSNMTNESLSTTDTSSQDSSVTQDHLRDVEHDDGSCGSINHQSDDVLSDDGDNILDSYRTVRHVTFNPTVLVKCSTVVVDKEAVFYSRDELRQMKQQTYATAKMCQGFLYSN